MAIFHFSGQAISRGDGRSSVAAACYRAAERILDFRTGEIHDYTRKSEVEGTAIFMPGGATMTRSVLWNAVESKHKRGDAIVARELEISLPIELSKTERKKLAFAYAQELAEKYRIAVDVCIHEKKGNPHMHLMLSACYVETDSTLGKKCNELDPIHCQRAKIENLMDTQRPRWQDLCNAALEKAGSAERIDHRSFVERGITDRLPGWHHGPAVSGIIDRGEVSEIAEREAKKLAEFIAKVQADAAIEAARQSAIAEVARLEQELAQAIAEEKSILSTTVKKIDSSVVKVINVTVTKTDLPVLTVDTLEAKRKQRVDESNKLFGQIQKLDSDRLKAKAGEEIEAAKIALPGLSKRLESLEATLMESELTADRLNFRFGGLYEMLPDWLAPERVRMKTLLDEEMAAVKKLQGRIQKAQAMAGASDLAKVDQEIVKAKNRRAQVIAEVQDIDADLVKARQREQYTPKPVQHSRLVRNRDQEHDLSL
jgi:hypothetical protein